MKPNFDIAKAFLSDLTGEDDPIMRFRFISDLSRFSTALEVVGTLKDVWPTLLLRQEAKNAAYYMLNEANGPADLDVTKVRAIPADFDNGLPASWEWHAQPDLIVHTSPGKGQALWKVDDCKLEDFKLTCRRIIALYDSDPAVCNLSRVLRLPGSLHQKGLEPHLVTYEKP